MMPAAILAAGPNVKRLPTTAAGHRVYARTTHHRRAHAWTTKGHRDLGEGVIPPLLGKL